MPIAIAEIAAVPIDSRIPVQPIRPRLTSAAVASGSSTSRPPSDRSQQQRGDHQDQQRDLDQVDGLAVHHRLVERDRVGHAAADARL